MDEPLLSAPLPSWMEEARLVGRWLANPKSRVLATTGYRRVYDSPAIAHRAIWRNRVRDDRFPVLVLTEDIKAELQVFLSGPSWSPTVDTTWLSLETPLGRAFARFLGNRPRWDPTHAKAGGSGR